MEIDALLVRLTAPDDDSRQAAVDALAAAGEAAFDPLVRVIAQGGPAATWRAERAFHLLADVPLTRYAAVARHPSPAVRRCALWKLAMSGDAAVPVAEGLVPLLFPDAEDTAEDTAADTRKLVRSTFEHIGPGLVPALRRARRTAPGRHRRFLVETLVAVGGWDALDTADQAVVRRLIAVKRLTEEPARTHVCGSWYAVRTTDQSAVLAAFGLSDPMPVTMRLGQSAWNRDTHGSGEHRGCSRAYVSPAFSGWTLVFGRPLRHVEPSDRAVRELCARLSAEHGAAHWYGQSCGDDWNAWCLAEDGEAVRYYDLHQRDAWFGGPHPAEAGRYLPHEDSGLPEDWAEGIALTDTDALRARLTRLEQELGLPEPCHTAGIAGRTSVDPASFGPDTPFTGHGVLALTSCGREHGGPPGVLEI
ncbi:hypothetical protein ABZ816_01810 [Actinosynnema sp. NPDC047251]|uniref:HEAT repeat domain-containing protein n=1 Tax=Saccharothrix espanaensis (strain ATCC 51144 / DSM 44229 / JCM 9112 / NBRC 15066 / NRRL 15764) TaxID=1179773 RepID=K0K355_SACES|nr:hypothetical protein [Saccharothrix espanaensis]CCH30988.1 hypothetical protein BN6_36950 [Saccharothrix espanaensis DSM 44229]